MYWIVGGLLFGLVLAVAFGLMASINDNREFEKMRQFQKEREVLRYARLNKKPRAMATRVGRVDLPATIRKQCF